MCSIIGYLLPRILVYSDLLFCRVDLDRISVALLPMDVTSESGLVGSFSSEGRVFMILAKLGDSKLLLSKVKLLLSEAKMVLPRSKCFGVGSTEGV